MLTGNKEGHLGHSILNKHFPAVIPQSNLNFSSFKRYQLNSKVLEIRKALEHFKISKSQIFNTCQYL